MSNVRILFFAAFHTVLRIPAFPQRAVLARCFFLSVRSAAAGLFHAADRISSSVPAAFASGKLNAAAQQRLFMRVLFLLFIRIRPDEKPPPES